ncbi:hypothetical protein [Campylobacter troglodytis]|uniref:hypothetical protein n=1 Tax=Campylobacter troglodytis TaxID=654363 RepID=UPI00115C3F19|nr:hypothetical protein [Campylobacter troglodytis]
MIKAKIVIPSLAKKLKSHIVILRERSKNLKHHFVILSLAKKLKILKETLRLLRKLTMAKAKIVIPSKAQTISNAL